MPPIRRVSSPPIPFNPDSESVRDRFREFLEPADTRAYENTENAREEYRQRSWQLEQDVQRLMKSLVEEMWVGSQMDLIQLINRYVYGINEQKFVVRKNMLEI